MRAYEYRHIVGFEETDLMGNVYFSNHILWQGRCRELFLRDHAPAMIQLLAGGLAMATTKVSCNYLGVLHAFDEVVLRMYIHLAEVRITLRFEYWRCAGKNEELVARGEQQLICLQSSGEVNGFALVPIPAELRSACEDFCEL